MAFAWTPFPDSAIEQAIHEASLLGLTPAQIQSLQTLREQIRRTNTLIQHKGSLLPALIQANIPREGGMPPLPWAHHRANNLNNAVEYELYGIRKECSEIEHSLDSGSSQRAS